MTADPIRLGFHFDVMCPWAYQTSKWIREVRETVPLDIEWRFFSLEEINREEGKKHPWEREWSYGWGMMRVAAMLRRESMDDCDRFYEAAGRALHEESRKPHRPEVAEEICRELGLDPAVVRAAIDDPTHPRRRARRPRRRRHPRRRVRRADLGVRRRALRLRSRRRARPDRPGRARPVGPDRRLQQGARTSTSSRHRRRDADMAHIAEVFRPYLEARDWESREKPAR